MTRRARRRIGWMVLAAAVGALVGTALVAGVLPSAVPGAHGRPRSTAIVTIRTESCGSARRGLGARLLDGRIITAGHVVTGATSVGVGGDREVRPAMSTDVDLAVLPGRPTLAGLAIGPNPGSGDSVRVAQPGRDEWADTAVLDVSAEVIELAMRGEPGDSGGPVIDDDGRLVGIVVSIDRGTGRLRALPASQVAETISGPLLRPPAVCR